MATPSVLEFYRGECFRGDASKRGPKSVSWTNGVTPALELTASALHVMNVTELVFVSNSEFALGGTDTFVISPWGLDISQQVTPTTVSDLYSLFERVGGRVVVEGADPLHLIRVAFRPFIRLEAGSTFTFENSGGATAALGDAADWAKVTAFAFEILAADE